MSECNRRGFLVSAIGAMVSLSGVSEITGFAKRDVSHRAEVVDKRNNHTMIAKVDERYICCLLVRGEWRVIAAECPTGLKLGDRVVFTGAVDG